MVRQRGFTIIEVLLFLAVSGMLFVIAVATLNATIRSTRFTDATNGLENFISQQYSDVRTGVTTRDEGTKSCQAGGANAQLPGASDSCVVVGRLLRFSASSGANYNTIDTYTIVANKCPQTPRPTENGCAALAGSCTAPDTSDAAKIATYCPRILGGANKLGTYELQWGIIMPQTVTSGGSPQPNPRVKQGGGSPIRFDNLAIIHSPTSERIYTFAYTDSTSINDVQLINRNNLSGNYADRDTMMCLVNPDIGNSQVQFVSIGAGQSSDLITSGASRTATQMPGGLGCS